MTFDLVYIDDDPDIRLSRFLRLTYGEHSSSVIFDQSKDTYDSLLSNESVKKADFILIDSQLFKNNKHLTDNRPYNGESFKLLLRQNYPFKECLVITQYSTEDQLTGTFPKYNVERFGTFENYSNCLKSRIDDYEQIIAQQKALNKQLLKDTAAENMIKEKINDAIEKIPTPYSTLTASDIDKFINEFQNLEKALKKEHRSAR